MSFDCTKYDLGIVIANDVNLKRSFIIANRCNVLGLHTQRLCVTNHKAQSFPNISIKVVTTTTIIMMMMMMNIIIKLMVNTIVLYVMFHAVVMELYEKIQ